jgi:glycosyltransferase involved in cell wall biosynthesis
MYRAIAAEETKGIAICRHHKHVLAAAKAGIPCVYLVPSLIANQVKTELRSGFNKAKLQLLLFGLLNHASQRRALQMADTVAVFSENMAEQVVSLAGEGEIQRLIHCKPGIDPKRFFAVSTDKKQALRIKLGLKPDVVQLLMVCRLVSAKGIGLAIESLPYLPENTHLVLVGEGSERQTFEETVRRLGFQSRVTFTGAQTKVEAYYQCSDAFVMASNYEPLGQTILEAGASGLPIVAFSNKAGVTTATEELQLGECVFFAHEQTGEALAQATQMAIASAPESDDISQFFHATFSWHRLLSTLRSSC